MHQDNSPLSSSAVENIKVGLVKEIKLIVCIMTHNLFKMTYFDKWSDIIPPAKGPRRCAALIHFFVSLRDTNGL